LLQDYFFNHFKTYQMKKLLLFLSLLLSFNVFAQQQWTVKAPMPQATQNAGAAVVNNIIYVAGGGISGSTFATLQAYDPSTNAWTIKAPMTVDRAELAVAAVNGKIYAIGGFRMSVGGVNTVEEYDPVSNTWTTKAPMPTTRSQISCAVINNKIYVVGGWPSSFATLEVYDPSTNSWATKAPCSLGRQESNGSAVVNNKMFFIGGKNISNNTFYKINEAYDTLTDSWTTYDSLPQPRWHGAAVTFNSAIHYLGGTDQLYTPNYNTHYIYNLILNTWSTGLQMIHARSECVAAVVNNKIYVMGGIDSALNAVDWNEEYSLGIGVAEISSMNQIMIYPNPSADISPLKHS
jgi:N-acetylneuraminic acid mutarotase